MFQDVRLGVRMLLKQPGLTTIAVFTLALGIGATAAVFSLIQGVLLTPPPYRQPERLILIPSSRNDGHPEANPQGWAPVQWMEWRTKAKSLAGLAAYDWSFNFLVLPDGSESLEGMWVTKDYFQLVGLRPLMGRVFSEQETHYPSAPVIILGYELWQRKFNGDPKVIGKTIRISRWDTPPVVIGVMPPGIRFLPSPTNAREPNYNVNALVDFWLPAAPNPARLKEAGWNVVARLRDGTSLKQAQAELTVLAGQQAQSERDFQGIIPQVQPLAAVLNQEGDRILLPLLGAAALVLLIACGNAAALLLVRGLQRQQEYAVRSALGISRIALFRQVLTENLLLALTSGALGVGLTLGLVRLFKLIGGHAIPRLDAVSVGWPVLASGLGLAVLSTIVAGLFPALRASRPDPIQVLKSTGPKSSMGVGERQLLRGVTTVQTALTLALLVGAGLLIRTMINLSKVQSGYDTGHILTMSVTAVQGNWADFHRRALERVSKLPGVRHAAFAWGVPLTGNNWPAPVDIEGQPAASKASDRLSFPLRAVTPGYFQLLGLAISGGRDFRSTDTSDAPSVAIVNRAFADRYFPHLNVIGKNLWIGTRRDKPPTKIIGITANARADDLTQAAEPKIYVSFWQNRAFSKHLVIQTGADPRSLITPVQRELHAIDRTVAIENIKTMDQIRGDSLASRMASRRREIAIRAAVGAERRDIRNLIVSDGFRLVAGGMIAGIAAALILSRVLRSFLFEVEPADPATLIGVGLLFTGVALLACWAPIHRAVKVNPVEILRYE